MHRYRDMNEPMRRQFLTRTVVATCLLVFRSHCSLQKASLYQAFRRPSPQWNARSWPSRQWRFSWFTSWVGCRSVPWGGRIAERCRSPPCSCSGRRWSISWAVALFSSCPFIRALLENALGSNHRVPLSVPHSDWRGGPVPFSIWAGSPCKTYYWYVTWEHRPGTRPRLERSPQTSSRASFRTAASTGHYAGSGHREMFEYMEYTACHRASRVHDILTEVQDDDEEGMRRCIVFRVARAVQQTYETC